MTSSLSIRDTARRIAEENAQSLPTVEKQGMPAFPTNRRMLDTAVVSKAGQQDKPRQER